MTREPDDGDALDAAAYSVAELRAMLFKGKGPLTRPLALALLGRKNYPQKLRDLERLLLDEKEMPRLRAMAGPLLAQTGKPAAARALERGLAAKNDLALRGALQGLELAGGKTVPKALQRLRQRKGLVGRMAGRTAALLNHRLGLKGAALTPASSSVLRVNPKRAAAIAITPARGKRVAEAIAKLAAAAPSLRLAAAGAVALSCAGRSYLFLFHEEALRGGLDRLRERKALAGVVAEKEELEGNSWAVRYQLLTEPLPPAGLRLVLATSRGTPLFAGTAKIKGEAAQFSLRALDGPGAVAIDVRGRFERGRLAFDAARSDRKRRPSLTPAALAAK